MHYFYLKGALAPAIVCLNLGSCDKPVQHRIQSMMNIEHDSIPISFISILSDHFDMGFQKVCETKNFPSKITSIRVRKRLQMLGARETDVVSLSPHIDDCQSCPACPRYSSCSRVDHHLHVVAHRYAVSPATRKSTVTEKEATRKSISWLVTGKSTSRKFWLIEPVFVWWVCLC